MLLELGHLPDIEMFQTAPEVFPNIVIGSTPAKNRFTPVSVYSDGEIRLSTGISFQQWPDIAAELAGQPDSNHPDSKEMYKDLLIAKAHLAIHGDILVTFSPLLLHHRRNRWVNDTNPRTPLEAAQIVGLFLRSRDDYNYAASQKARLGFDRGSFYWVLARHRLPNMWRYFSACVRIQNFLGEDVHGLGESILLRCVRALQARDAIGIQFYLPQNNETRDQMLYHFDYLTLILAGALDAEARIARHAYGINLQERFTSFRNRKFLKELKRAGAERLYEVASDHNFKNLLTLVHEPRNTIHGAAFRGIAYQAQQESEESYITVPQALAAKLWQAADNLGGASRWGLIKPYKTRVLLEPYSFTTALAAEGLSTIDSIAGATDVLRLFPGGQPSRELLEEAPQDGIFDRGPRLELLG